MNNFIHTTKLVAPALLVALCLNAAPEIQLTGRKDLVLSEQSRVTVLDVARLHLSEKDGEFLVGLEETPSPYSFELPPGEIDRTGAGDGELVQKTITYDDASVLRVVAKSFSAQVRGTLARGDTSFLQLKGGSLIKPGTSFPATVPQAQGQTFTITITEINSNGYTLKLGEAEETVRLGAPSAGGSGAIRRD